MRYVGRSVRRSEDEDLLTGRTRMVADLDEPDVLELAFVRSPVAHGRLRRVDVDVARAIDGVVGVWAASDLPDLPVTPAPPGSRGDEAGLDRPSLARDVVRFTGEAIAVAAAGTRAEAEDATERVALDIEPLPAVTDATEAAQDDALRLFPDHANVVIERALGTDAEQIDATFAGAEAIVECDYREQFVIPTPLEARAVLARSEPSGGLTVWVSHQAQHRMRAGLCEAFALEPDEVRVIMPAAGGAFGSKSQMYPEYIVAAHLARLTGRPVRWVEDRAEALLCATRGRGQQQHARLAATADGTFLAYELSVDAAIGGYPHTGGFVPTMTAAMAPGAYQTPHVRAQMRSVATNTAPTSAYRGAGRPEAAYAIERTVDRMARRLGIDPAELRRRNFIPPDAFPYRTPTGREYDSGAYAAALDKALETVGYGELRAAQKERRRSGRAPLGIGIATYVERSGAQEGSDEYGGIEVLADGTILARSGSTSTGQGHRTSFAQLVADALDVDLERVSVIEGDTREVPHGFGTFGSRSMQVGGEALWRASAKLIEQARRRLVESYDVELDEVTYRAGRLVWRDGEVELEKLAPLHAEQRFETKQAFPFGAYIAVVEVDVALGVVHVVRLVAVDDYGTVVNPLIVEGQTYGSIVQGLGQALYEEAVIDEQGVPIARTLLDYLLPTIAEVPPIVLEETHTPNPNVTLGVKGAGEAGCIGVPPAIVNAVCDALDVEHIDMPLTPEAVWRATRNADSTLRS